MTRNLSLEWVDSQKLIYKLWVDDFQNTIPIDILKCFSSNWNWMQWINFLHNNFKTYFPYNKTCFVSIWDLIKNDFLWHWLVKIYSKITWNNDLVDLNSNHISHLLFIIRGWDYIDYIDLKENIEDIMSWNYWGNLDLFLWVFLSNLYSKQEILKKYYDDPLEFKKVTHFWFSLFDLFKKMWELCNVNWNSESDFKRIFSHTFDQSSIVVRN